MKITDVRVEHYRWPKAKPIANGKHTYTHNDLNLLVIDTDEGITGYGCSWAIEFAESMGKAIIGMDPLCNEQIFAKTYVPKFIGRRGKRPISSNSYAGCNSIVVIPSSLRYGILLIIPENVPLSLTLDVLLLVKPLTFIL